MPHDTLTRRTRLLLGAASVLLVAAGLGVIVGCGKKDSGRTSSGGGDSTPATSTTPGQPQPTVTESPKEQVIEVKSLVDIQDGYMKNEIAADAKYKGKRVRGQVLVEKIGRDQQGRAFIAQGLVLGAGGTQTTPNFWFFFDKSREAEMMKLEEDKSVVTVEGTCDGRTRDGIRRGGLDGYDWRITFTDCRVIRPAK